MFFFKQKTAYEMRISDWSADVCSSDLAFGGRILDKGEPKYLNSPETPLFHKGYNLYALAQALPQVRQSGQAIVVEGYTDVIALHQEIGKASCRERVCQYV